MSLSPCDPPGNEPSFEANDSYERSVQLGGDVHSVLIENQQTIKKLRNTILNIEEDCREYHTTTSLY